MYVYYELHKVYFWFTCKCIVILHPGLNTVECYNPRVNEWRLVAPMSTRRSSVGVGVVACKYSSRH